MREYRGVHQVDLSTPAFLNLHTKVVSYMLAIKALSTEYKILHWEKRGDTRQARLYLPYLCVAEHNIGSIAFF